MKRSIACCFSLAAMAGIALTLPATAAISVEWITVGYAGNAADTADGDLFASGVQRYGSVGYAYNIGKYEVTRAQYGEFLNAKAASDPFGLYNTSMLSFGGISRTGSSGSYNYTVSALTANRPIVFVSWFDAARFCNWMTNGQGNGDTETGSYTLNGATSGIIAANPGAGIRLPTEDEWYKAAYFLGSTGTYARYPNGQNTLTKSDANISGNGAVAVGSYPDDPSFFGTFDQGGNVYEWNDAIIETSRGLRGGSFMFGEFYVRSSYRNYYGPGLEYENAGFRLAVVPESGAAMLTLLASGALLSRRRR